MNKYSPILLIFTAFFTLILTACIQQGQETDDSLIEPKGTVQLQDQAEENPYKSIEEDATSTFSIDVDTASYSIMRQALLNDKLPNPSTVRLEEYVNYFNYEYPAPSDEAGAPFTIQTEFAESPWNPGRQLIKIGLKGREIEVENFGQHNLVFLIDTSGSMSASNKLPLLKSALNLLVDQLSSSDSIAIVTYAGSAGIALEATSGDQKATIKDAINRLKSSGYTNGEQGIQLAYSIASANFISNGNNRVILATDGDFNVGQTDSNALVSLIQTKSEGGIYLTALGFGMNYNDAMLESLADKGDGNYAYIDTLTEAKKVLVENIGGTLLTIAKDVKIQVEFNPETVSEYRLLGYNNRRLQNQDFQDDSKDAGEIGAGHTVTAFYEIVLQPDVVADNQTNIAEIRLRYKNPKETISQLLTQSITAQSQVSDDFYFAAAVAEFALLLENSPEIGQASYEHVIALANTFQGADLRGYRQEFIQLAEKAQKLTGE